MTNHAPITLGQLFRYWRNLPHQAAAIIELEDDLQRNGYEAAMHRDRPWFSVWSQSGLQADDAWLAPATKLIQSFEGLSLTAYRDPVGVWTIGYGSTRLNGEPVREGDTLTTVEAEGLLRRELLELFGPGVFALLPLAKKWRPEQQAALVSWAFNVGLGAVEESTLRRRLLAGEDPATVVREELPRWDKADGKPLAGLTRRRQAEVALFTGGAAPKFTPGAPFSFRVTPHITYGELTLGEESRRFQHQYQCDMALNISTTRLGSGRSTSIWRACRCWSCSNGPSGPGPIRSATGRRISSTSASARARRGCGGTTPDAPAPAPARRTPQRWRGSANAAGPAPAAGAG